MRRTVTMTFFLFLVLALSTSTGQAQEMFERVPVPPGGRIDAVGVTTAGTPIALGIGNIWRYDASTTAWAMVKRFEDITVNSKRIITGVSGAVYAATTGVGCWRSTDDGQNWERLLPPHFYTNDVLELPSGDLCATANGRGFLYSADNGSTWEQRNEGLENTNLRAVARDAAGDLYVAHSSTGVSKSTDNGMTWTALADSPTRLEALLSASDGSLYTAGYGAVYRSVDNGATWQETSNGPSSAIACLAEAPDGSVYAMRFASGTGIYRYDADSDTWTQLPNAPAAGYGRGLTVASDGTVYAGTVNGVWYTKDEGQHWTEAREGIYAMGVYGLVETADGSYLLAANYQGLFRSTDRGMSWTRSDSGLTTIEFYAITAGPDGDVYAGGRYGEVFRSTDSGISWTHQNASDPISNLRGLHVAANGSLLAAGRNGIQISTDKGVTWDQVAALPDEQANTIRETSGGIWFATFDGSGVYRSTDAGGSWELLHPDLADSRVKDVAVNGSRIFLGVSGEGVTGSGDNGATWTYYTRGDVSSWVDILEMTEHGELFAGHDVGVSMLNPVSEKWVALGPGLHYVKTLTTLSDGRLYAGSLAEGLYRSKTALSDQLPAAPSQRTPSNGAKNTGSTPSFSWTEQSGAIYYHIQVSRDAAHQDIVWEASLHSATHRTIDPNQLDTNAEYFWRIAAGNGAGHGPWSETWSFETGMSTGVHDNSFPGENSCSLTSSPNPFTSTTQLEVTVPRRGHVLLRIIDMLGRTVATLADSYMHAGMHVFAFSASALPAGNYLAVLKAGGSVTTHRLLLMQ